MEPTTPLAVRRRRWLDGALILLLAGAGLLWSDALLLIGGPDEKMRGPHESIDAWRVSVIWWYVASVPAAAAIVLRHGRPLVATLLAAGSAGIHLLDRGIGLAPLDLAVLIALYHLANSDHTRRTVLTVLVAAETLLFVECLAVEVSNVAGNKRNLKPPGSDYDRLAKTIDAIVHGDALAPPLNAMKMAAVPALLLAATWAVADNARTRRAHLATLQARAEDLEREQRQRTALAVATERGRITRELHDVVAHGLSVIVVQAQGAKVMLNRQPQRTETALINIVTTGRASLAEMRRLLGLGRTESGADLAPQPSLATLPELIDRVRDSGTQVDFRVTGEPVTLPAVIELAAYRIVQEALTNTLKHATRSAACTVDLDFGPAQLAIRVTDNGGPVPSTPPGNGLRGLTERVHALGGDLRAGPAARDGFEVSVRLPVTVGTSAVPVA
jgi:signal transduction histidine kinase